MESSNKSDRVGSSTDSAPFNKLSAEPVLQLEVDAQLFLVLAVPIHTLRASMELKAISSPAGESMLRRAFTLEPMLTLRLQLDIPQTFAADSQFQRMTSIQLSTLAPSMWLKECISSPKMQHQETPPITHLIEQSLLAQLIPLRLVTP